MPFYFLFMVFDRVNPAYTNYTLHHMWLYFDTLSFNHKSRWCKYIWHNGLRGHDGKGSTCVYTYLLSYLTAFLFFSPASEYALFIIVNLLQCLQSRYLLTIVVQPSLNSFSVLLSAFSPLTLLNLQCGWSTAEILTCLINEFSISWMYS